MTERCECCNRKLTEEMLKEEEKISDENAFCYCSIIQKIINYKKKVKKLNKELKFLNALAGIAMLEEWDLESVYQDILDGDEISDLKFEGIGDPEFAKWFAKRFIRERGSND